MAPTKAATAAETDAEAEEAPKAKVKSGKVVKYIGTSDVREIDAAAWKNIGIDQDTTTWSRANNFRIPVADMAAEAVKYCEESDASFVVTDADS